MKYINILSFLSMVLANFLANFLPIGGRTTGEISSMYPNLFTPAGFVFSIWSVIYLLLLIFAVLQLFKSNQQVRQTIGWYFTLSCILNIAWIIAWHHLIIWLSLILMAGLLLSLVIINLKLRAIPSSLFKATFGIYLGWICIAAVANSTIFLMSVNWGGLGLPDVFWATAMVVAGALIAALVIGKLNNFFVALPVAWAFYGIIHLRIHDYLSVAIAAAAGILIVLLVSVVIIVKQLKKQPV
ncbi:MAG TPA: TspO/MBR family protein [Bacteroidales bacterium]|nr:TspO/MBR family protein [Bacteroidales bacterium]